MRNFAGLLLLLFIFFRLLFFWVNPENKEAESHKYVRDAVGVILILAIVLALFVALIYFTNPQLRSVRSGLV